MEHKTEVEPTWETFPIEIMIHDNHICRKCKKLIKHATYSIKLRHDYYHLECYKERQE